MNLKYTVHQSWSRIDQR